MHRDRGKIRIFEFAPEPIPPLLFPGSPFSPLKVNDNQGVFPKIRPPEISLIHNLKRALAKKYA